MYKTKLSKKSVYMYMYKGLDLKLKFLYNTYKPIVESEQIHF